MAWAEPEPGRRHFISLTSSPPLMPDPDPFRRPDPQDAKRPAEEPGEDRPKKMEDFQLGGPAPDARDEEPQFRDSHPPSGSHRAEDRS